MKRSPVQLYSRENALACGKKPNSPVSLATSYRLQNRAWLTLSLWRKFCNPIANFLMPGRNRDFNPVSCRPDTPKNFSWTLTTLLSLCGTVVCEFRFSGGD